jgi:hypothetical protein
MEVRPDRQSNLRFNSLLNPPMFKDHDQFLAEYILMYESQQISNHFGLLRKNKAPQGPSGPGIPDFMHKMIGITEFCSENYFIWGLPGMDQIPRD